MNFDNLTLFFLIADTLISVCGTVQTRTILSAALHANLIRPDSKFFFRMSSNVKILVRFILSEPNSLITWDANYLPKKLDLNATTWLPFDVFNQSYRNFEQKFLRGRECQENCPTQISLQLPKVTLDRIYLYDALLLLGKALGK